MKKCLIAFILAGLASTAVFAQDLGFCLNLGLGTDQSFSFNPIILSGGAEFDFHIGEILMVSPEAILLTDTKFKDFLLIPAVSLNVTPSILLFGAGIAKVFVLGGDLSSDFMLKLNGGLRAGNMRISAYMLSDFKEIFKTFFFGIQLGFEI